VEYLRNLCHYWGHGYDWRRVEARMAALPNIKPVIDGVGVHAFHRPSASPDAIPLLLTHGWPGSVVEFLDVIEPLADAAGSGALDAPAFHVVCPSLPGYGFSDPPQELGWSIERIADAWAELMSRLGYDRFIAQGGDWGAFVSSSLAVRHPHRVIGIHLNYTVAPVSPLRALGALTEEEEHEVARLHTFAGTGSSYAQQQMTRPQTLAAGLSDSPAGQCAWILEKLREWSDCSGDPVNAFSVDQILDNITLYWLSNTAASSARLYHESLAQARAGHEPIDIPTAYSAFPRELACMSERWVRTRYPDLRYYRRAEHGGHFAAFEQPEIFVAEVRAAAAALTD
jgi:pimeloyl-ACP methyl ester carboxylesterase